MGTARAPLAGRIPRPAKLRRDRYASSDIPANIRAFDAPIDAEDRAYLRRKLGAKLGKFARAIERVTVRVRDVNGPRGGVDKACTIAPSRWCWPACRAFWSNSATRHSRLRWTRPCSARSGRCGAACSGAPRGRAD